MTIGTVKGNYIWMVDGKRIFVDSDTAKIYAFLGRSNLSKLAKLIGVHRSYLSKIKHGHYKLTESLYFKLLNTLEEHHE